MKRTRRAKAIRVRRLGGQRRQWLFYLDDGGTALLGASKLSQMSDDYASMYLFAMNQRENRYFSAPVDLYLVKGRKPGAWLVHRIDGSAGMMKSVTQKRIL